MRILVMLLILFGLYSKTALAEWTVAGRSAPAVTYVDRTTIVRNGTHASMWNMSDYTEPQSWQGQAFLSSSAQFEYDCAGARSRMLVEYGHSEHMGQGERTYSVQGPRPWAPANPGTIAETKLRSACGQ